MPRSVRHGWCVILVMASASAGCRVAGGDREGWRALFDGRSLAGWQPWLGPPAPGSPPVGPRDVRGVFRVVDVDGGPAIRISGEIFGALTSEARFADFHLVADYRFGQRTWPPRRDLPRNSGILYRAFGAAGAHEGAFMYALELQIQEGDTGDLWLVGPSGLLRVLTEGVRGPGPKFDPIFTRGAPPVAVPGDNGRMRVVKARSAEREGWNRVEIICQRDRCAHVVNGHTVVEFHGLRRSVVEGGSKSEAAVPAGPIQLQSAGAETFFRGLRVKPL